MVPLLFPEADAPVLEPRVEDGEKVEPEHFAPLLPLLLINGAAGIGTGWSTAVCMEPLPWWSTPPSGPRLARLARPLPW